MSFAKKFNKSSFAINTTGFNYVKLSDLYNRDGKGKIYPIDAMFINHGKLGSSPVFVNCETRECINIPSHMTERVEVILSDNEAIADIQRGIVGFSIYEYESHNRKCYSVTFEDIEI